MTPSLPGHEQVLALIEEPARAQILSSPGLLTLLRAALSRAEATPWVAGDTSGQRWYGYLARRLPATTNLEQALCAWCTEDLRFCFACVEGGPEAVAAFHAQYLPLITATLQRLRLKDPLREEVQDRLVIELLVGDGHRPPLLTTYHGAGKLTSWLRVVTTRTAHRALEQERPRVSSDELLAGQLVDPRGVADLAWAREEYQRAFGEAFREAIGALEPRQLNLLKHRHVDGLTLQQVGAIFHVHHATVLRWLEQIKAELLDRTRRGMVQRLKIPDEEWSTIFRMIHSQLDVSLHTFLRPGALEPPDEGEP